LRIAITRPVSPKMGHCELTFLPRTQINIELARAQHGSYEKTLERLGCRLIRLSEEPDLPDSVFVEDVAVVLDEIAIITRPGAASRRPETVAVAKALGEHRELFLVQPPGTLDGGDVLRVGKTLYVGLSSRSNPSGIEQVTSMIAPLGYRVVSVPVRECLHLKSAVTQVGPETLLLNRRWVDPGFFPGMNFIEVHDEEPLGANALIVENQVVYSKSFPRTCERLKDNGIFVNTVDVSETEKAEGAVTCCSLVFNSLAGVSVG
jgi:dimethylargininase